MQLKIIVRRGQCRGRPPTYISNRDGPGEVGSWQLAVGSLWSAVSGQQSAAGLVQNGTWNMEHGTWNMNAACLIKRRWGEPGSWTMDDGRLNIYQGTIENHRIPGRTGPIKISLARDWVNYTWPVSWKAREDRDNDRISTKPGNAAESGAGELCPELNLVVNKHGTHNCNINRMNTAMIFGLKYGFRSLATGT